jgi:23S rRNA (pseudouridine1915-N3)-methyltransferase
MHLRLIAVGKLREPYLVAAAEDFRRRLRPYHRLEEIEVRAGDGGDAGRAMGVECEAILRHIAPSDQVWLLERTGTELSSEELAARIERLPVDGISLLTLVIAGTYGAAPALLERAQFRWSLSRLTLLHEWARALVLEQLYRAAKIAANEPYHH